MLKDYYKIIGLTTIANPEVIDGAFQTAVLKYHPKFSKVDGADDKFLEVFEAHEILHHSNNRFIYDSIIASIMYQEKTSTGERLKERIAKIESEHSESIESWKKKAALKAKYYGKLNYQQLQDSDLFNALNEKNSFAMKLFAIVLIVFGSPVLVIFFDVSIVEIIILLVIVLMYYAFMSWVFKDRGENMT